MRKPKDRKEGRKEGRGWLQKWMMRLIIIKLLGCCLPFTDRERGKSTYEKKNKICRMWRESTKNISILYMLHIFPGIYIFSAYWPVALAMHVKKGESGWDVFQKENQPTELVILIHSHTQDQLPAEDRFHRMWVK
jgi:hypothetical protein